MIEIFGFIVLSAVGLVDPIVWINYLVCRKYPGFVSALTGGAILGAINYSIVAQISSQFRFNGEVLASKMFAGFLVGLLATWITSRKKTGQEIESNNDVETTAELCTARSQTGEVVPFGIEQMAAYHWQNAIQFKKIGKIKEAIESCKKTIDELSPKSEHRVAVEALMSSMQSKNNYC